MISDSFNRANGALGANWVDVAGTWAIVFTINAKNTGALALARHVTAMTSANHYAEAVVEDQGIGPAVRVHASDATCYALEASTGDATLKIVKFTGGVRTELASEDATLSLPDTLRLEVIGSTLTGYLNGVATVTIVDTSITGNLYTGMFAQFDDRSIDSFAAAAYADAPTDFGGRPEALTGAIVPIITVEQQGFDLSGVTYTAATRTLTKTGAFAAYTHVQGDSIYITGGTAVTKGRFAVATRESDDEITLHRSPGALDAVDVSIQTGFDAPYACHVSAHLTTFNGSTVLQEAAEYSWDFGDVGSTETLTDWQDSPTSTPSVNTNDEAWTCHAKALHVYREPGTYTITLTVRRWNGESYDTEDETQTINVRAWTANTGDTMYFDPANSTGLADNANSGLTTLLPKLDSPSDLLTFLAGSTNGGRRVFFMSSGTIALGGTSIETVSTCRRYILPHEDGLTLTITGTSGTALVLGECSNQLNETWCNWVFQDVAFSASGTVVRCVYTFDSANGATGPAAGRHLSLIDGSATGGTNGRVTISGYKMKYGFLYRTAIDGTDAFEKSDVFGSGSQFTSVVGCTFNTDAGNPGSTVFDHFIYPDDWGDGMIAFNSGTGGHGRSFFVNGNTTSTPTSRMFISNNRMSAAALLYGIDLADSNNDSSSGKNLDDVVIQRNAFSGLNGGVTFTNAKRVTVRDNKFWDVDIHYLFFGTNPVMAEVRSYRNRRHLSGTQDTGWLEGTVVSNYVKYETIQHDGGTAGSSTFIWRHETNADVVSELAGNQYWFPNMATPFYDAVAVASKNLADWQALGYDADAVDANPNWTDPANGNFSEIPLSVTASAGSVTKTGASEWTILLSATVTGGQEPYTYAWTITADPDGATEDFDGEEDEEDVSGLVVDKPGSYTARLTVTDGDLTEAYGEVTFRVGARLAPLVVSGMGYGSGF